MTTTVTTTGITFNDATVQTTAASSGTILPGVLGQVFTANGTFTIPTGVTAIKITVAGGGGGGGGQQRGSAGGGAGVAISYLTGLTAGATLSVTIGSGGAGGASGGGNGSNGGNSTVASGSQSISTITGGGGGGGKSGGTVDSLTGGDGGTASGGSYNATGQPGMGGVTLTVDPSLGPYISANGGSSIIGSGGIAQRYAGGAPPTAPRTGGGGNADQNFGSYAGATGGAGLVIFEW